MVAILNGGWTVRHKFERGPLKNHPNQIWLNLVANGFREEDLNVIVNKGRWMQCDAMAKAWMVFD